MRRAESVATHHRHLTLPVQILTRQALVVLQVPVIPVATAILLPVMIPLIARILAGVNLQKGQVANQRATLALELHLADLHPVDDHDHDLLQLHLLLLVVNEAEVEVEVKLHRVEGEMCADHHLESRTVADPDMIHHRHILHSINAQLPVDALHSLVLAPVHEVLLPIDIVPIVRNHLETVMVEVGLRALLLAALLADVLQALARVERAVEVEVLAEAVVVV